MPKRFGAGMDHRHLISLAQATNREFTPGRPSWFIAFWMLVEFLLVTNPLQVSSTIRVFALRAFGATVGRGVIMRPRIRVKFPWRLRIGDHCWIGEGVWIHNQDTVEIGSDTVISQEAFITTGSHDAQYTMDLIVKPVRIGNGVWITSRCMVLQGVDIGDYSIVLPGSVVHKSLPAEGVYGGMPAQFVKPRWPAKPQ